MSVPLSFALASLGERKFNPETGCQMHKSSQECYIVYKTGVLSLHGIRCESN